MNVSTYKEIYGKDLTVRELVRGFREDSTTGRVVAFDGILNVRPEYQREFIYSPERQQSVIETIMKGYPLNVMYWAKTDDGFELMDGQQRTMSICRFHDMQQIIPTMDNGQVRNFTIDEFDEKSKETFYNYPVTVYICDGSEKEKMDWFRVINSEGLTLTQQEMRNAIYTSPWVTDAKKYFSDPKGSGMLSEGHLSNGHVYGDYVNVTSGASSEKENAVVRQKLLEIVLEWACDKHQLETGQKITIEEYMRAHKKEKNATALWRYFEDVMEWTRDMFPTYNKIMKKIPWGMLYNRYHEAAVENSDEKANQIIADSDELKNTSKAYEAVLTGNMKLLQPRSFDERDKNWAYKKQNHRCAICGNEFELDQMDADHIIPWSKGGTTTRDNLQMLCRECNIRKSNHDVKYTPWDKRVYEKHKDPE